MFLEALKYRYATKKFDQQKKISDQHLHEILEAGRFSPSSFGLQAYKFVVIGNDKLKRDLFNACYQQEQITSCSHLIVIQAKKEISKDYIKDFIALLAKERKIPFEQLHDYQVLIEASILGGQESAQLVDWNKRQAYIALGMMMSACALMKIDSCPMEGFTKGDLDNLIGTDTQFETAVLLAVGYRSQDDHYQYLEKVRYSLEQLVTFM